jgi:phosphoribosyl 1,2-cyclic phosphodiesterase
MAARFSVLASGSAGNSSLLQLDGTGVLIDLGLGPRELTARLAAVGAIWSDVKAALLTHTHGDHWKARTIDQLLRQRIPLYCHAEHQGTLLGYAPAFASLLKAGLVRLFTPEVPFMLAPGLIGRAFAVSHDSVGTFGFRIDGGHTLFGPEWSLGYAADLGCWTDEQAQMLANVDGLALEFNHDVGMEKASGRPAYLVARVLGDCGHLSNRQAGDFVQAILGHSTPGRLRHLIQLHLSRDCNRPALAVAAARTALLRMEASATVYTAQQDHPGPSVRLDLKSAPQRLAR